MGGDVALYDPTEPGAKPDAVVMVMAENPYAEGQGDIDTLAWQQGNSRDLALIVQPTEGSRYTGGHRLFDGSSYVG